MGRQGSGAERTADMTDRPTIFLTAAEASGDSHGAGLVAAMKRRLPQARLIGAGGMRMAEAGCEIFLDMTAHAAMGAGPLLKLRYFHRCIKLLRGHMRELKPDVVVPIDSPALNWHIAKAARKVGSPVMYYVAPQVWAWAPWRVKKLRRLTDAVACILPFEENYLRPKGVNARFVGHPMFDQMAARPEQLPDLAAANASGRWRVAVLPGSRTGEIASLAGSFCAAAEAIQQQWPNAVITFTAVDETAARHIREAIAPADWNIVVGKTAEVLADSHMAVAASGTVTLEVAHYGVPMVVAYRGTSKWGYRLVGRWLIRIPHLSLVNILAGREIVPELMPYFADRQLTETAVALLADPDRLQQTRDSLLAVTAPLENRPQPTAEAVADLVIEQLER